MSGSSSASGNRGGMSAATTDRPRRGFAWLWTRLAPRLERAGMARHRQRALTGLTGRVVDVGCGHGASFPLMPAEVTHVVGVEPEPNLRADAERAAADAPVPVEVRAGVAEVLPVDDGWADAVVCTLVLCSVDDPDAAAAELRRVLRPGGQLRMVEHVRAANPLGALVQRLVDVGWPHLGGGCHTSRATVRTLTRAGFRVEQLERFRFPPRLPVPTAPHVRVRATSPHTGT